MKTVGGHGLMYKNHKRALGLGIVLALLGTADALIAAQDSAPSLRRAAAKRKLAQRYPAATVSTLDSGRIAIYGQPMTAGATPRESVSRFLADLGAVVGISARDLRLDLQARLGSERHSVLRHKQFIEGLPVENGFASFVVLHGNPPRLVYVAGDIARLSADGLTPRTVGPDQARATVRNVPAYTHLPVWSDPELVVFFRGLPVPVRCWKFVGMQPKLEAFEAYTFFLDATSGDLVHVRNEVYHVDIDGHVAGLASPGTLPDVGYNAPDWANLDNLRVRVQGGNTAFSDENGDFTIPHVGATPVTVRGDLIGDWVQIINAQGSELTVEESATPPGPVDLLFNPAPQEFTTAQVNGFLHTTLVHEFFKNRQPEYGGLDIRIPCNVNITDHPIFPCNAFFSSAGGPSINFFGVGGGCVNSAYSSIIAHEYGHFIVNRLGLSQGSFGEGFGDSVSVLLYDDAITGRDFAGPGAHIRNLSSPNIQYPCSSEIHHCGRVLGGFWWDLRVEMGETYGDQEGLERTRQLFTDWAVMTAGGLDNDAAHPLTAIEVLTVDDNDGELANGTPNFSEICSAFAAHNVPCPLDCNNNGVPDFTDIANGTSDDVDGNGVPDDCHVIRTVPADFQTIQSAINAADEGDSILVAPGVYRENLFIATDNKTVLIKAAAGPENTIIDGRNAGSAVTFQSFQVFPPNNGEPDSRIEGFTITNGNAQSGGGIRCVNSNPRIVNCRIIGNAAGSAGGGGIHCEDGYPLIQNCLIANNTSSGLGGGVRFDNTTAAVRNCMIQSNAAAGDGAAVFSLWGSVELLNCTATENIGQSGTAFYNGNHTVADSILWGNHAPQNDELRLFGGTLTVDFSTVMGGSQNVAVDGGNLVWQDHNLDLDPQFAPGPIDCYYLHAIGEGQQTEQSPCIDAGSANAVDLGLDGRTTRGDEGTDAGVVDMGYHYPVTGQPLVMGDFDRNGAVDLVDFGNLQACNTGVGPADVPPCCRTFDFQADSDVDLDDYGAYVDTVTGPQHP